MGRPSPEIREAPRPTRVALSPPEFRYLRPRLKVNEGDSVRTGQTLFESKDDARLVFVSPGTGKVEKIRYGARRRLLEVVVAIEGQETFEEVGPLSPDAARGLSREKLTERLLRLGLWPMIRQYPYAKIADPNGRPASIFVSAMADEPVRPIPDRILEGREADFQLGLDALKNLTDGPLHLCFAENASSPALTEASGVQRRTFNGPYPAGNPAVHIYHVAPPASGGVVWSLGVQDVLAVAAGLTHGRFSPERIVAVGGPGASQPAVLRSRLGASVESLTVERLKPGELRFVSGGVLSGRSAPADGFLGFYDDALFILPEGRGRELLNFFMPGFGKYSLSRAWASSLLPRGEHAFDTNLRGSLRNFVLQNVEENLCPVDIWPQQAAKAVLAEDFEEMEKHGVLDCAECGLCTFACPSKIDVAAVIRKGIDLLHEDS